MAEAPKKGRLTLYEDLLSEETKAELAAKDAQTLAAVEAKKKKDASILFKPTHLGKKSKAPVKPKANFASAHKSSSSTSTSAAPAPTTSSPGVQQISISSTPQQQGPDEAPSNKRGFDEWLADENDDSNYLAHKHDRNASRKKKKKGKEVQEQSWSWADIYDPETPVSFLDYPKSEVQIDIDEQWKERLHSAHEQERQRRGKEQKRADSENDAFSNPPPPNMQFAPSGRLNFAPPADYSSDAVSRRPSTVTSSPYPMRDLQGESADKAFNHRAAMSSSIGGGGQQAAVEAVAQPTPAPLAFIPPIPQQTPPASAPVTSTANAEAAAKAQAQIAAFKAKLAAQMAGSGAPQAVPSPQPQAPFGTSASPVSVNAPPPPPPDVQQPTATPAQPGVISAAPTYNPEYERMKAQQQASNAPQQEQQSTTADPDAPRSNRPGQMGFAEKYMKKHGHQKGQGLGAQGDGIITPIVLQQNKRKKRPDAEGGGFAAPQTGRIVGGKRAKTAAALGDSGEASGAAEVKMTEVVKIEGMLANLDVDQEIQDNDLLQEIGEEMGNYGKVERLFIWRQHAGGNDDVFVKYTSPLSALNAIKACDGQEFADNIMAAKFWDAEKFEQGEYA